MDEYVTEQKRHLNGDSCLKPHEFEHPVRMKQLISHMLRNRPQMAADKKTGSVSHMCGNLGQASHTARNRCNIMPTQMKNKQSELNP